MEWKSSIISSQKMSGDTWDSLDICWAKGERVFFFHSVDERQRERFAFSEIPSHIIVKRYALFFSFFFSFFFLVYKVIRQRV